MNTQDLMLSGETLFRLPIGQGMAQVVAIPNRTIDPSIAIANHRPLPVTSAYESTAQSLLMSDRWTSGRVFVTSPRVGDGKTRTAFNLAGTLTSLGKSVLLVEMNFAEPRFRALLGNLRFHYGLDTAILGASTPTESVFSVETTGLHVTAVRNPTAADKMERGLLHLNDFFDWASACYELLIVDCPPVLSQEWDRWFHAFIGQALLVVREQQTPLIDVRNAVRRLDGHLTGALLNRSQDSQTAIAQRQEVEKITAGPKRESRSLEAIHAASHVASGIRKVGPM